MVPGTGMSAMETRAEGRFENNLGSRSSSGIRD